MDLGQLILVSFSYQTLDEKNKNIEKENEELRQTGN
jgi:hypothetical protein